MAGLDPAVQPPRIFGCAKQLDTQTMSYIDTIADRRVDIADPVTGLVLGFSHFHHSMKKQYVDLVGVPG